MSVKLFPLEYKLNHGNWLNRISIPFKESLFTNVSYISLLSALDIIRLPNYNLPVQLANSLHQIQSKGILKS